ncbi:hypothetical protein KXV85_003668, partial [Aspergillus fumigatus]
MLPDRDRQCHMQINLRSGPSNSYATASVRRASKGTTMKAAVYDHNGPPEVLRYTDVPDPKIRSRDVLIQVEAISVEGGDLINRR